MQPYRIAERCERIGFECPARLLRVGSDRMRVQADEERSLLGFSLVGEQRVETAAKAAAPERSGRCRFAHTGLGMPAADSTAPPRMRASRLALNSR